MNRQKVKILMVQKGVDFKKLASAFNVTTQSIYEVMKGDLKSSRIEALLEDVFEMPIDEIRVAWNNTEPGGDEVDVRAIAQRINQKLNVAARPV